MSRPKKDWKVIVFAKNKKKGEFKGENILEALTKAEEKVLYNMGESGSVKHNNV